MGFHVQVDRECDRGKHPATAAARRLAAAAAHSRHAIIAARSRFAPLRCAASWQRPSRAASAAAWSARQAPKDSAALATRICTARMRGDRNVAQSSHRRSRSLSEGQVSGHKSGCASGLRISQAGLPVLQKQGAGPETHFQALW